MIVDRDALRNQDPTAIAELQQIVQRIAKQEARRYRASAHADDIAQEVLLDTMKIVKHKRDDEDELHIEGFIRKAARNRAISCLRARRRLHSVDGDYEFDAGADTSANTPLEAIESREAARAVKKAMATRPEVRRRANPAPVPVVETPAAQKEVPAILGDPPTGEEIRKLRRMFGMTQKQFSKMLGLSVHTLRNYEYKVVLKIPAKVVKSARNAEARGHATGYLAPPPFLTLARGWMRDLGIKPRDYAGLANYLGFNRSTVWRWFNEDVTPSREVITKVTVLIEEIVRQRRLHARGERV